MLTLTNLKNHGLQIYALRLDEFLLHIGYKTIAQFFGKLSVKRWDIVCPTLGKGAMSVRELTCVVDRDVKRVHDDIVILAQLGVL